MNKKVLITGISWFIWHHLLDVLLKKTDYDIVWLYRNGNAGNLNKIEDLKSYKENKNRVKLLWSDLRNPINNLLSEQIWEVDYILHLWALTHVDRSILYPMESVMDNVIATVNILEFARTQKKLKMFNYFSTDEVFWTAPEWYEYKEWDRHNPWNPYSAWKSSWEMYCKAYNNTYWLPIFITNCMNVIWERQDPEKFLPKVINYVLNNKTIHIHSNKDKTKAWTRFYLDVQNIADAIVFLMENAKSWDSYNIVWDVEVDNLEFAKIIAKEVNNIYPDKNLKYEMVDFHSSRPWHDLRYALDWQKLKNMGYNYPLTFEESVRQIVNWYLDNPEWLKYKY